MRTKLQKFLRSYVERVYTIQNGAYERNGLKAYSVDGHNIVLNWITEITDLLQFFVGSVKCGQIMCNVYVKRTRPNAVDRLG